MYFLDLSVFLTFLVFSKDSFTFITIYKLTNYSSSIGPLQFCSQFKIILYTEDLYTTFKNVFVHFLFNMIQL